MSAVKDLAAGALAWARSPRSPAYSKLTTEGDAEALRSPTPPLGSCFSRRLQRLSPKAMLALVAPLLLFSGLLFTVPHGYKGFPYSPSPNLCKMLMSALVSGYPSPVIVNWGRDFNKGPGGFGDSHLGKIDGSLDFLDAITSDDAPEDERLGPDDLVLIVDAYDVWFQLPPSILIRRYMAQNHAADERIRKEWSEPRSWFSSDSSKRSLTPRQSIIISTQKKCWPDASLGSDPHCDQLPESSARKDMYGPHTDEDPDQMHDRRPRYVNSGSIIGPVGEMRRMLRRAQEKVVAKRAAGLNIFSDQGIFAEIFGEQEIWRTLKRKDHAQWVKNQTEHPEDAAKEQQENDFGVGLDYIQDLFTPTVFEEVDGLYVVLSNGSALRDAAAERGIIPPRVSGVPEDMIGMRSPLEETGINIHLGWNDLPLYTDFWSTSVPVMVHHNAHRNGLKEERLRDWWKNNWFFPYLRQLLEVQAKPKKTLKPLLKIPGRDGVEDLVYGAPEADTMKRKTRIFNQNLRDKGLIEADWDGLCKSEGHEEWWKDVLQDSKGPV
ncbi:hypothetical protein CH63R_11063 [Colletotrichum higginsianum IMI 349063]|uniref:Uncharacterized protein n=4 Tax=Colletotrichum higginsianum TaxID=80884 RepID=A0A1B7XX92_COLHI|nr:hypothetical protein CH63R_11063 [Colletotrichum higginsianum IMI 349063]OBR04360.1 hypothetical protein CH63R_11063 [Colletotrichum higginsianum IMI 349063]